MTDCGRIAGGSTALEAVDLSAQSLTPAADPIVTVRCWDCGQGASVRQSGVNAVLGRWHKDHDRRDTPPFPVSTGRAAVAPETAGFFEASGTNEVRRAAWATRRAKYGPTGHAPTAYPPRVGSLREHLEKALECLTDEFNAGRAGPSGLRAQAIAHLRYGLLLIDAAHAASRAG